MKRSCEHMAIWWPPTNQEKRLQNETNLPALDLRLYSIQNSEI